MKKSGTRWNVTGDGLPIFRMGSRQTKDGTVFFISASGRDIHLTYYARDRKMYLHVTDAEKVPRIVWSFPPISIDELATKITRQFKRMIVKYHPGQKMYVLAPKSRSLLASAVGSFSGRADREIQDFDILKIAKVMVREHAGRKELDKVRIKDALKLGVTFGYVFSKTQAYMVIPLQQGYCMRVNTNPRRGLFGIMPMWNGIDAWMKHLDDERVLDEIIEPIKKPLIEKVRKLRDMADIVEKQSEETFRDIN